MLSPLSLGQINKMPRWRTQDRASPCGLVPLAHGTECPREANKKSCSTSYLQMCMREKYRKGWKIQLFVFFKQRKDSYQILKNGDERNDTNRCLSHAHCPHSVETHSILWGRNLFQMMVTPPKKYFFLHKLTTLRTTELVFILNNHSVDFFLSSFPNWLRTWMAQKKQIFREGNILFFRKPFSLDFNWRTTTWFWPTRPFIPRCASTSRTWEHSLD